MSWVAAAALSGGGGESTASSSSSAVAVGTNTGGIDDNEGMLRDGGVAGPLSESASTKATNMTHHPPLANYLMSVKSKFLELAAAAKKEAVSVPSSTPSTTKFHFVMGNEAGDADSIVSAIAYAYWIHTQRHQQQQSAEVLMVPVSSIPIRDLQAQRPETLYLLQTLAGLSPIDEYSCDVHDLVAFLTMSTTAPQSKVRYPITLMDHNELSSSLRDLSTKSDEPGGQLLEVVQIVDHHLDTGSHTDTCPPAAPTMDDGITGTRVMRNIAFDAVNGQALVASTCTLVVEEMCRALTTDGPSNYLPAHVSILLLGTILLDSINLDPTAGKVTDRDVAAVNELLQRTDWDQLGPDAKQVLNMLSSESSTSQPQKPDTTVLFNLLQSAKFDVAFWESLTVEDALRLDYKQFSVVKPSTTNSSSEDESSWVWGMSAVLLDVDAFFAKLDWDRAIHKYMIERQLDLLVVMLATTSSSSSSSNGGDAQGDAAAPPLQRMLVLCDLTGGSLVNDLVEHLTKLPTDTNLRLVECPRGSGSDTQTADGQSSDGYVRAFQQGNAKASRKQVAPILFGYFETILP